MKNAAKSYFHEPFIAILIKHDPIQALNPLLRAFFKLR